MDDKGWFGTVVESVIKAFHSFIGAFKKNGIVYTLFVLLIFVLFWSLVINPLHLNDIIEKRLQIQFEQQQTVAAQKLTEGIERRYTADEAIGDIMAKVIDKFGVNRVALLEAHNSLTNLNGVDFLYMSCSMEMLSPNAPQLNYICEDLQRQVILNLLGQDMITLLKHRDYLYYNSVESCIHPQHRLLHKIAHAGDKECLLIPFKDPQNRPLLLLVITGENLNVEEITEYIDQFRTQITQLLM